IFTSGGGSCSSCLGGSVACGAAATRNGLSVAVATMGAPANAASSRTNITTFGIPISRNHTKTCVACYIRFRALCARRLVLRDFSMNANTVKSTERHPLRIHPAAVRTMHWINAVAMIVMIGSGWKIYNDEVLFGWLRFPDAITIGGEAQGALQWHFFAMWILMLNGLAYLVYGCVTGRF